MGIVGCGGGLEPTFGPPSNDPPKPQENIIPVVKSADIAGVYDIDSVLFDADVAITGNPPVLVNRELRLIPYSENGVPKSTKARLDQAYLIIGIGGNFSFYFSIVNEQGQLVKVGPFDSGGMSGQLKMGVQEIGFMSGFVSADAPLTGLADEQETMYSIVSQDKKLVLRNVDAETPTPHFSEVTAIPQK